MDDITSTSNSLTPLLESDTMVNTNAEVNLAVKMKVFVLVDQGRAQQDASVGIGTTAAAAAIMLGIRYIQLGCT